MADKEQAKVKYDTICPNCNADLYDALSDAASGYEYGICAGSFDVECGCGSIVEIAVYHSYIARVKV